MFAIVSLLIAVTLALIITRVATVALMLTGLSRASAKFQARSAFTGVGFTTSESEKIVNHPVRRQIILALMLLGNVGIATVVATLILSLAEGRREGWHKSLPLLLAGLVGLWVFANSLWVERQLNRVIVFALKKFTRLDVRDYVALLELDNGFAVSELIVNPTDWLAGKTLLESRLAQEGILVLGIKRHDGTYIGAPTGPSTIEAHDTLILYGTHGRIKELDDRRAGRGGDFAHRSAVYEHGEYLEQLKAEEEVET